jgi:hypothetical protein
MNDQWTNRREIRSETSSRLYIISQHVTSGDWGCTCPGYKRYRLCKHLTAMGLTPHGKIRQITATPTAAVSVASRAASARSFSDSAYAHYDISTGFGGPGEWIRIAEELAAGRGSYRNAPPPRPARGTTHTHAGDMALLGLAEMPADVSGVVKAMRRRAMVDHPDHGGTAAKFTAMFDAYNRLLAWYPKR